MGINQSSQLLTPEDIFKLRQGKIRCEKLPGNFQCERKTLLEIAELLIILNDAENLTSQADAIERAISYDYFSPNNLSPSHRDIPKRKRKISLKKNLELTFGYCFGLLLLFCILYQLDKDHLHNPFFRTLNFTLYTSSYFGAVYVSKNNNSK